MIHCHRTRNGQIPARFFCLQPEYDFEELSKVSKQHQQEVEKRRTFGIISHPDAGKTTLTEKLLLFGGAIQMAGAVKARKAARHGIAVMEAWRA
jgi:hypothetical protein